MKRSCLAKTRMGIECQKPPLKGKKRCRLHGGASTGPRTAQGRARIAEAHYKHGRRSKKFVEMKNVLIQGQIFNIGQNKMIFVDNRLYIRSQVDDMHNFFYIYNTELKKLIEQPDAVSVISYLPSRKLLLKGYTNGKVQTLDGSLFCKPFSKT